MNTLIAWALYLACLTLLIIVFSSISSFVNARRERRRQQVTISNLNELNLSLKKIAQEAAEEIKQDAVIKGLGSIQEQLETVPSLQEQADHTSTVLLLLLKELGYEHHIQPEKHVLVKVDQKNSRGRSA